MEKYYLAVDIGASSGRHILGRLENGKIELEEIYRFENGMDHKDGKLLWDVNRLFGEIVAGMKKCKELGKIPVSMAIDTWAVDYVLLDEKDQILGDTYGYRDHRTDGMDAEVAKILPETELYGKTYAANCRSFILAKCVTRRRSSSTICVRSHSRMWCALQADFPFLP